jgi:hypothetical protein
MRTGICVLNPNAAGNANFILAIILAELHVMSD